MVKRRISVGLRAKYDIMECLIVVGYIHRLWKRYTSIGSGCTYRHKVLGNLAGGTGDFNCEIFTVLWVDKGHVILADITIAMLKVGAYSCVIWQLVRATFDYVQANAEELALP